MYIDHRLRDLSERLNLSREDGEKWIVNLIRDTRMGADARIDLEKVRIQTLWPGLNQTLFGAECY